MINHKYFALLLLGVLFLNAFSISTSFAGNGADESGDGSKVEQYIHRVLELVNIERANYGLNPLTLDSDLIDAAMVRSFEITKVFGHIRPDGSSIATLSSKINGENIAAGNVSPEETMIEWMNSPGHRVNILNPNFKTLGVGYTELAEDPENSYYYWVQLFGGVTPPTPINKTTTIILGKISSFKAVIGTKDIKLTWNKPAGATVSAYQVFKYNSKIKDYSLIKTTSKDTNYYKNTGLASASTYSYKIRYYYTVNNQNYYSPFSSTIKLTTKPSTPKVSVLSGKNKVTIKWKKVDRASGYEIRKSYSKNGVYTLKKNIKKGSITKFVDSKSKKKKYSYYKVRAYKTVDGKKTYSSYGLTRVKN